MREKFVILLLLFSGVGFSQTCCSGGVPLSNNIGVPNEGKGVFIVNLSYDYNNLNTLLAGTEDFNDDSRERITHSSLLSIGYGLTDKLSLEALFSWVNQSREIRQFGNTDVTETSGIGDAVFLVKYAFPNPLGKFSLLSLGLGAKAPLGASDMKTDSGIQLTADLQPGSGAWDGIGWLSVSKGLNIRPSANVFGTMTYRLTGTNNSYLNGNASYTFGNEVIINAGYIDEVVLLNTLMNPVLGLKYRKAGSDEIEDREIPNTGGEWIFLRPEVHVLLWQNIYLNTSFEMPLYSYVEGIQLTPTYRFSLGMTLILRASNNDFKTLPL